MLQRVSTKILSSTTVFTKSANQQIRIISEGLCDSGVISTENSALLTQE